MSANRKLSASSDSLSDNNNTKVSKCLSFALNTVHSFWRCCLVTNDIVHMFLYVYQEKHIFSGMFKKAQKTSEGSKSEEVIF